MVTPPEGLSGRWPDHVADPFGDALDAYRARFGDDLPHLLHVDRDVAARVMARAVARGRPIRPYLISRLSGGWRGPPPFGVLI
ncbi:hypothetical protein D9599_25790 [Roseomonas sp. KE2513]|nr:hypothetical protein [Roseomonas sp. KE2513]